MRAKCVKGIVFTLHLFLQKEPLISVQTYSFAHYFTWYYLSRFLKGDMAMKRNLQFLLSSVMAIGLLVGASSKLAGV